MVESQPDLATKLRRVRGGYLKIQGTWMPYEIALRLARRYIVLSALILHTLIHPPVGWRGLFDMNSSLSLGTCGLRSPM